MDRPRGRPRARARAAPAAAARVLEGAVERSEVLAAPDERCRSSGRGGHLRAEYLRVGAQMPVAQRSGLNGTPAALHDTRSFEAGGGAEQERQPAHEDDG